MEFFMLLYNHSKEQNTHNNKQHGGKFMNLENYAEILKFAINGQINYEYERINKPNANEEYISGIITGLQIALDKINASEFLWKEMQNQNG